MSTLGNTQIVSATVVVPEVGALRADVALEDGGIPTGSTTLAIGSLSAAVDVLRSDFDDVGRPRAITVGGIGWQKPATPLSFQSSAGVRLRTVLEAIASAAGQKIEQPEDKSVGDHFGTDARGTYADLLTDMIRVGLIATWRVDLDGVTRFIPRASTAVTARATLLRNDSGANVSTFGVDDPAEFLPGNTIDGARIARTVIRDDHGRTEVDTYFAKSRTIRSLLQQIAGPNQQAFATYTVAAIHGDGTMDLLPGEGTKGLRELKNVEQWTLGGSKFKPAIGSKVAVGYRDVERTTQPFVLAFDLDGGPFSEAARKGDTVRVLLPPLMMSGTMLVDGTPTPFTAVAISSTGSTLGTIDNGSAKVGTA